MSSERRAGRRTAAKKGTRFFHPYADGVPVRVVLLTLLAALAFLRPAPVTAAAAPAAPAAPWLFVSDVHLEPLDTSPRPSPPGHDTNPVLLRSALAEMRRVDPAPPVVVISGDYIGHRYDPKHALDTMARVAHAFGAAFPHAQFVLALGNEDSDCGDYGAGAGAPFLRAMANLWAPLVDRNGAAPHFRATFPRDGFYVARLPLRGLRAVVIDDVFASPRFRAACGASGSASVAQTFADLERALPSGGTGRAWVVMHVPPGVDAYSTVHLAHGLGVVPFLDSGARDRLTEVLGDPRRHVALALAGHTHKFGFRVVGDPAGDGVPLLIVPALSPIFENAPMFLTAEPGPGGTLGGIVEHAFDGRAWRAADASRELDLPRLTGPALGGLERRLDAEPALRTVFSRLYDGGAPPEITPANWRGYRCAISALGDTAYRRCLGERGLGFLTVRGLVAGVLLAVALLFFGAFALLAGRRFFAR